MTEPLKTSEQLQLELREIVRGDREDAQVVKQIIKLYAAEFEKANAEISRLRARLVAEARLTAEVASRSREEPRVTREVSQVTREESRSPQADCFKKNEKKKAIPSESQATPHGVNSGHTGSQENSAKNFILPTILNTPAFREAWAEWTTYRRHRRHSLTPETIKRQLAKLEAMGCARAVRSLHHSIEQGYIGIFEPSPTRGYAAAAPLDKSKIDVPDRFKSWAVARYPAKREAIMSWHTWADVPNNGLRQEWWREEKAKLPIQI